MSGIVRYLERDRQPTGSPLVSSVFRPAALSIPSIGVDVAAGGSREVIGGVTLVGGVDGAIVAKAPSSQIPGYIAYNLGRPVVVNGDYSIMIVANATANPGVGTHIFETNGALSGTGFSVGSTSFSVTLDGNSPASISGDFTKPSVAVAVRRGNVITFYAAGQSTTGVTGTRTGTITACVFGRDRGSNNSDNGCQGHLLAAFDYGLSVDQIDAILANPWLVVAPEQIYVPFASGGATDYPVTATDALTLADSASQAFAATGVAAEALTLADSASNVASLGAANSAALTLADSATNVAALSATATDALTLADTLNATASGDYTATSSDALTLADSASNVAVLGATASDALTLADAASNVAAFIATITEAMTLADTSNGSTTGMFTATITESMFLADTLLAAGGSPASFWTQISTTQVAGWGQTDNTQSSGWTIIPTT